MKFILTLFIAFTFQMGLAQIINSTNSRGHKYKPQKKIRFGFNLDWNMGYTYARSNDPLEFMGRHPNPDVFGGSFDFLYKDDWLLNFSWKIRKNYYRIIHRFTPPNNDDNFNKTWGMYRTTLNQVSVSRNFETFGLSLGKHIFKKSKWQHYLNFGVNLNLFQLLFFSSLDQYNFTERFGNLPVQDLVYRLTIISNSSEKLKENKFLPNVYYLISYKLGYTSYYPIAKGKLQLIAGCGFEYFSQPYLSATYTLFSKYDNVNTSGTFQRSLTNAFIKIGLRFGKMGVAHFKY